MAVVGSGPSGLTCAVELRRRGHDVVLFDEHDSPGGILVQGIPEHRLPRDVLTYETDWILSHGITFKGGLPGGLVALVIGTVLARNLRVRVGDELTLLGSGRDGSFAAAIARHR